MHVKKHKHARIHIIAGLDNISHKIRICRLYLYPLIRYTTIRILYFLYLVENIEKVWEIYNFFIHFLYRN